MVRVMFPACVKLIFAICMLYEICDHTIADAKPVTRKIMKGKLHRDKRDVDILAECDLQCLSEDEVKDYELLIEYDYGPDGETQNNFYSDENNKKCSYSCKILDMEKTDENTGTGQPGEYSISFEDSIMSNFRPNLEESPTISNTMSTASTVSTTAEVRKADDPELLLRQCLELFATFGTPTAHNSPDPCAAFQKKAAEPTTSTLLCPPSTTESTTESTTTTTSTTSLSTSTISTSTPTTSTDSNLSRENPSGVGSELNPDINQDIAVRELPLPADERISLVREQTTQPPKRVIPKIIRYTVVEAEMMEEGSNGDSGPSEVIEIHQIDPEVIKSVDSSMMHISSGLASIKNMSKSLPLKHQYELVKTKPKKESSLEIPDPVETEIDEYDDEVETTDQPDIEITPTVPTLKPSSTLATNEMNPTEQSLTSSTEEFSLEPETSSLRPFIPTTPIERNSNLLHDSPFDFPFIYDPKMPEAHFTRNKTKTVITFQNITSVQTNHTVESFAYALINDKTSTTSTSKTLLETTTAATKANAQPMSKFEVAPIALEVSQSTEGSNIGDELTQNPLEGRWKTADHGITQDPPEEHKVVTLATTKLPLENHKNETVQGEVQHTLEEQEKARTINGITKSPLEEGNVLSTVLNIENPLEKMKSATVEEELVQSTSEQLQKAHEDTQNLLEERKVVSNATTERIVEKLAELEEVTQIPSEKDFETKTINSTPRTSEQQQRAIAHEATKNILEERKVVSNSTTERILEKPAELEEESPSEKDDETKTINSTTETILQGVNVEGKNATSRFFPAVNTSEENIGKSVVPATKTSESKENVTEPSDLNSTPIFLEELASSTDGSKTERLTHTNESKDETNNSSLSNPERDFRFSGKFSAKDNSSYPTHFKNTLIENLKKLDNNASVVIGPENIEDISTTKKPIP